MKIRSIISFFLLGILLLGSAPIRAQRVTGKSQEVFVKKRFEKRIDPRVTDANRPSKVQVHHGIVATLSGIFYNGDIIQPMDALKYGEFVNQFGASLTLNYKMIINPYVSMRFGVQGGLLRGSNRKAVSTGKLSYIHEFQSLFAEPFVGVECYPILNYGFFIYGGLGVAGSKITKYEHTRKRQDTFTSEDKNAQKYGIVPMFQLGIGYNWWLTDDWTLGIELLGQYAFVDGVKFGLDAWPNKQAFDLTTDADKKQYQSAKLPDGFLQLGLVVSYHFKNKK